VDGRDGAVLCTISLPRARRAGPKPSVFVKEAIAVDERTRRAFVIDPGDSGNQNQGQVGVFDTGTGELLRTVPVGQRPMGIADRRTRRDLVLHRPFAAFGRVLVLDAKTGLPVRDVAVALSPVDMRVDEPLGQVFVADGGVIRVLDTTTGDAVRKIST
jgi:DNA-binding beta-propeller fold protein YncE